MDTEKTPFDNPSAARSQEDPHDPEVEGHYMNQFAAEQEAQLRQNRLTRTAEQVHRQGDDDPETRGIIGRVRRRLNR